MQDTIRVGIVGYGNLGKGVEIALSHNKDFKLEAIFTRRDPSKMKSKSRMIHISEIEDYKDKIDVMILCGGSALDLPEQGPKIAENFNTVDSFDTHARIPKYFDEVDKVAKKAGTLSLISIGWDPGLFSLNRILAEAVLPNGKDYTFWGKGVSQGHSDAIRRINGVKNGVQYTVPVEKAIERVRSGENPELAVSEKHNRICYVVPENGADVKKIEEEIKNMPNYFADYDTEVHFITEDILKAQHSGMPHGGFVIRTGTTSEGNDQRIEFSLNLSSNPQFTASVIVAYARAVYRLSKEGKKGAQTIFDIPLAYISPKSPEELRKELL
ncbi:diaminopimelate dehydrogenase [Clostridium botulinum]|uniref:Meso-diaminopimelate D-dehydrogenase n=1 Tax=Clostridium botulinum TaxID=1491 RepID=A0A9Q1V0X1_CLOBO|nr:diaminopimelate dehydrogenase [Clostridium botulinum]AEB76848.1 diaminopimelate dehydrogenase [Clostridium botulinum BKT015925]KEI02373.1 cytochrome C2 [Clostridium botulinum C/D str. Sp77]KEI02571.1 cytochrome C2 [Clostridium botulinum D str. 16868]KLU76670.1 cytochrome C2 [Clostridium botulinum V891]KOA74119.1 cytochrome C2 [Clostridium botulinum]